jgi:putative acetyltransferase
MGGPQFSVEDPRSPEARALLGRHLVFARGQVPLEDAHALDVDELADPTVTFYALRIDGQLLAVGALKRLDEDHAELKSMHTAQDARGRGLGRAMLSHLLTEARERGFKRVSLETGAVEAFAPARSLYASSGFTECEPFADYRLSPNSTYMTLKLARD